MVLCNKCFFVGMKMFLDFMLITASVLFFFNAVFICGQVTVSLSSSSGGTSICLCFYTSDVHLIFLGSDRTVLKP